MDKKKLLKDIYNDFSYVIENKNILGILLYGSYIKNVETSKSDIDICIVAPSENKVKLLAFIFDKINVVSKKFDIRFLSELPLYIKIQVIEEGELIYSPDEFDLYEYFYLYRKLWADQKHRHAISKEEILAML